MSKKTEDEYTYRGHFLFAMRPGIGLLTEAVAPEFQMAERGWERNHHSSPTTCSTKHMW